MAAKSTKKKDLQEELQIEQAYQKMVGVKKEKKRSGAKTFLIIFLILILAIGTVGAYFFFIDGVPIGKILDNVTVASIDVGGLTKQEAIELLSKETSVNYSSQNMVVTLVKHSAELSPVDTNIKLDCEAAVNIAYSIGRRGSYAARKLDQMKAGTVGIAADVSNCIQLDRDAVYAALNDLAGHYDSKLTQSTYEVVGQQPSLSEPEPPADDTQDMLPAQPVQELVIVRGTPSYDFSIDEIYRQILNAYSDNIYQVEAECQITYPDELDLNAIHKETSIAPVDAVMDTTTFEVSDHTYGYEFDLNAAISAYAATLPGNEMRVPFRLIDPQVKKQDLTQLLYRDVLSEYTAYTNSSWGRQTNLRLSCEAINDYIIFPGETFSYNPVLGERTPEKGWEKADGYVGNLTVSQYGGGICQASSCLYLCAMLADMEIVERTNHGFISAYMPYGMDATVSWGGPEFLFKNTSEYPIKIVAIAEGGNVTVKLLGTDTKDYYVKMEYEVLEVYPFNTVTEEHAPNNKHGYKDGQVIITPYTGYKISTYRCKYDKATNELITRTHEVTSEYARRDKVVCKIVDPNAPTETTPAPTQPTGISGSVSEDG